MAENDFFHKYSTHKTQTFLYKPKNSHFPVIRLFLEKFRPMSAHIRTQQTQHTNKGIHP